MEHVGIVVRDLDRTVEFYEAVFGWGPFQVSEVALTGCLFRGQRADCRLRTASAQSSGAVRIELIQVLEGQTPHLEFLQERGEGLHHLGFMVDGLDVMLAEWAGEGIEAVWQHSFPELGISWTYLSADAVGGVMMELMEIRKL
jgi:catechol 2,3-dioxygenase-like lactoylglutathione lyase family enzyme